MSRPFTAPRTTSPTTEVPASALRPGDVVVYPDGSRWFAAFDVSADEFGVTAWTAVSDQEAGVGDKVFFKPDAPVRVRSTRPIPGVSRISVNDDPTRPPFYGKPIDCPVNCRWAGPVAPEAAEEHVAWHAATLIGVGSVLCSTCRPSGN